MTTYGTMNSTGKWADVPSEKAERLFDMAIEREAWFAPRKNRTPMTTHAEVAAFLAAGNDLQYGDDWYEVLRAKKEGPRAAQPAVTVVRCDCGHSVQPLSVMHASLGTSCVDCYDRLSA
jgi:hypothetical protein